MKPHVVFTLATMLGCAAIGWLVMARGASQPERPKLLPRIQSLPSPSLDHQLPAGFQLASSLVSPGGPVWLLLYDSSSRALICGFERATTQGVSSGRCMEPQIAPEGSALVLGGGKPVIATPSGRAFDVLSGQAVALLSLADEHPHTPGESTDPSAPLRPEAPRGTRLIRHFSLAGSGVTVTSPREGQYVGPFSAYAGARSPKLPRHDAAGRTVSQCVTPSGYILATWRRVEAPGPGETQAPRGQDEVSVAFFAGGRSVGEVTGQLPRSRHVDAELACRGSTALISWVDNGPESLGRLSCNADGCTPGHVSLPGVATHKLSVLAEAAQDTFLVWPHTDGSLRLRIGPFEQLATSPTAPLFEASEAAPHIKAVLPTGDAVLLLASTNDRLALAQLTSSGTPSWLRIDPRP